MRFLMVSTVCTGTTTGPFGILSSGLFGSAATHGAYADTGVVDISAMFTHPGFARSSLGIAARGQGQKVIVRLTSEKVLVVVIF